MHSCIFLSPVDASQYLVLLLPAQNYSGLVEEAASPPICFLICPLRLSICPVWVCLILQRCIFNTLAYRKNIEDFSPFLGVPLLIFDVRSFPEEAPDLSDNLLSLSISALASEVSPSTQSFWQFPLLSKGCRYPPGCLAAFCWDSLLF